MKIYLTCGQISYKGNWCVINFDRGLGEYYRWWVKKLLWKKITPPLYGFHVTVVAGKHEQYKVKNSWEKYQGKIIPVEYSNNILSDGTYYWLKVYTPWIKIIRNELGLSDNLKWPAHLTIGHLND